MGKHGSQVYTGKYLGVMSSVLAVHMLEDWGFDIQMKSYLFDVSAWWAMWASTWDFESYRKCTNASNTSHADISCRVKFFVLVFIYFVYASSEDSGESALSLDCLPVQ